MGAVPVLVVMGTRPEVIKLAPVLKELRLSPKFKPVVCFTGQHRELVLPLFDLFEITPDFDLEIMTRQQRPVEVLGKALSGLDSVISTTNPKFVIVQGDTTTALAGGLAAAYNGLQCVHVEAGLRSHNKTNPFPEELNRVLLGDLSTIHFVPTQRAKTSLEAEGIHHHVYVVGNTVVDALLEIQRTHLNVVEDKLRVEFQSKGVDFGRKIVALTFHRRESFGSVFASVCDGILELTQLYPDVQFVFPVHPNPAIHDIAHKRLSNNASIVLTDPLSYTEMIFLLSFASLAMTDSGGIVEEAPSLGTPVMILREKTERKDAINAGVACLVSPNRESVVSSFQGWRDGSSLFKLHSKNPFGDGNAAHKIVSVLTDLVS